MRRALLLSLSMLASCRGCEQERPRPDAAPLVTPPDAVVDVATPDARVPSTVVVADAAPASDAAALDDLPDGGVSSCRLAYGPAEQPFRGPAALVVTGQELRLVANDSGKPRIFPVPITPHAKSAPPVVPPKPSSFVGMRWPPCELAGRFAYCQAPGNQIVRTVLGTTEGKTVGKNRSGTRIAAATLGGADHSVVAFLDLRKTTEGDMLQAFAVLDERDPVRLSDDGAGATTLRFLQRGDSAVALYLDTRTAMVPIHARPVSLKGADLGLGADNVIFVGGAPERGVDFTVAQAGTKSFVFVPMPRETLDFGMAAIPVEDPVKDDVPAVWSRYPNGIDPAPIAAAPSKDGKSAWVARVRPRQKEPGSPRVLELGKVDATGVFSSLGEIAPGKAITDIALIDDGAGVWILYGDTTVTWLERRVCG